MAKITIFGLAGTGTSSVGKILSSELNYDFISSGSIFREKAKELNLSLNEFEKLCSREKKYDLELDQRLKKYGQENDDFVIESRLAWFFIPDSLKIKITCDLDTRISRVAKRDNLSFEEAKEKTMDRENVSIGRYKIYYNIKEFAPDNIFDLVIDSTNISQEEIVSKIIYFLNKHWTRF